jgi:hypothetical protein
VRQAGDFLGETHDDLVSGDPLHVCVGVVNSLTIAASIMDLGVGLAMLGPKAAVRVGARQAALSVTRAGERFVRVGETAESLKFTFLTPGGAAARTYAFPLDTFTKIGMNPVALKNLGDLPGGLPTVYRILEPPPGTLIQRGVVPGGVFGGAGGVPEVFFPVGF